LAERIDENAKNNNVTVNPFELHLLKKKSNSASSSSSSQGIPKSFEIGIGVEEGAFQACD